MFTLIFLFIRAFLSGVEIHGYGDFRSHAINCMDWATYIFWGILVVLWIVCLFASNCRGTESEEERANGIVDKASLMIFFPFFLLVLNENTLDPTTYNNPSNTGMFALGCGTLVVYFILTFIVCKKIAKANIFTIIRNYVFFEAVVAGVLAIIYAIFIR